MPCRFGAATCWRAPIRKAGTAVADTLCRTTRLDSDRGSGACRRCPFAADDRSTWLLERQLTPKFKRMGTMKEGCGGITEQIPFQGLAPEDILSAIHQLNTPGSVN